MNFNFELTEDEANLVLKALAKLPFEEVFVLVSKIKKTAGDQVEANRPKPKVELAEKKSKS